MVDFAALLERSRAAWHRKPFVSIDVETTGLDSFEHRIVELGLARFEDGRCVWSGSRYVHPECDPRFINYKVLGLTRIDPKVLMEAPPFWKVYNELAPVLDGAQPVAFNAPFDRGFVHYSVARSWPRSSFQQLPALLDICLPWVDPCALTRHFMPGLYGYRLSDCVRACGLPKREKHTAEDDALSTGEILAFLCRLHGSELDDFVRTITLQRQSRAERQLLRRAQAEKQAEIPSGSYTYIECDVCGKMEVMLPHDKELPKGWSNNSLTICGPACDRIAGWSQAR